MSLLKTLLPLLDPFSCPSDLRLFSKLTPTSRKRKNRATGSRIEKLQSYNEIKDVAQELMGLVAENRGVMVGRLYEDQEFGVSAED